MDFHDTEITIMVGEEPKTFAMRVGYQYSSGLPAQREAGGREVSPAEPAGVEVQQVELQVGDRFVNMSFLLGLFSEQQAVALQREIMGEK